MPRLTEVEGGENLPLIKMFAMLSAREIIILCTFQCSSLFHGGWLPLPLLPLVACLALFANECKLFIVINVTQFTDYFSSSSALLLLMHCTSSLLDTPNATRKFHSTPRLPLPNAVDGDSAE